MKQNKSCLKMWHHKISLIWWLYNVKAKLVPLPHEWRERGWITAYKEYIVDLTSCSLYRHFSSTCKWYLLFVNDNFAEKWVLKIINWIYIFLGNDHHSNFFAKVITIKTLFASANPSAIANCWGEFWGLFRSACWQSNQFWPEKDGGKRKTGSNQITSCCILHCIKRETIHRF